MVWQSLKLSRKKTTDFHQKKLLLGSLKENECFYIFHITWFNNFVISHLDLNK